MLEVAKSTHINFYGGNLKMISQHAKHAKHAKHRQ